MTDFDYPLLDDQAGNEPGEYQEPDEVERLKAENRMLALTRRELQEEVRAAEKVIAEARVLNEPALDEVLAEYDSVRGPFA